LTDRFPDSLCTQEQPPAGKADKKGNYPQGTVCGAFQKKPLAGSWRKTTPLRSFELRRGRQVMAPGGPSFAEASARQATHGASQAIIKISWTKRAFFV